MKATNSSSWPRQYTELSSSTICPKSRLQGRVGQNKQRQQIRLSSSPRPAAPTVRRSGRRQQQRAAAAVTSQSLASAAANKPWAEIVTHKTMPATPMLLARMPQVGVPYLLQEVGVGRELVVGNTRASATCTFTEHHTVGGTSIQTHAPLATCGG